MAEIANKGMIKDNTYLKLNRLPKIYNYYALINYRLTSLSVTYCKA